MKYTLLTGIIIFFSSCSSSFINHDLKYEKIGECGKENVPIRMISNINGERYEFQQCMNSDFNGKAYTITRDGDSIKVNFPKDGASQSLFRVTLDIDAKPAYHHIFLDGREIKVVPATKF